jgi:hypothetical protein
MKLLIGIPTGGAPTQPFLQSLAKLELPPTVTEIDRITVTGNFAPGQRELILRRAISTGADVLAMIDDDIVLPPDALVKLADVLQKNPDCGLAGALYYSRDGLRPMAVNGWDATNTTSAHTPAFDDREPVAVDGVGFGCVLLRCSVLSMLEEPFMDAQVYVEQGGNRVRICNEDYIFCGKVRLAGYSVVLHPAVRCGHYDRASNKIIPESWEPVSATAMARMTVIHADGSIALAPFDANVPQAKEHHMTAVLDYIFNDKGTSTA